MSDGSFNVRGMRLAVSNRSNTEEVKTDERFDSQFDDERMRLITCNQYCIQREDEEGLSKADATLEFERLLEQQLKYGEENEL